MNTVKKIVSIVSITGGIIWATTLGIVGATEQDSNYDLNKDGSINTSDAVVLSKFLCGLWAPSDVSTLDVNQNGIVDWIDKDMIIAKVLDSDKVINTH